MLTLPLSPRFLRNRPRLMRRYRQARRAALGLLPIPTPLRVDPVRHLHALLPRARFQRPDPDVEGWLTTDEQSALYLLARFLPGRALEIGCWLGKSSICLARGRRDGHHSTPLVCCDFFPTEANFRAASPGRIGFYYPTDHPTPMGVGDAADYERTMLPMLRRPGGLRSGFEQNLRQARVWEHIHLHVGDFRTLPADARYDLVFCDAMHDELEIRRNAPDLARLLAPGAVLCCHDSNEANIALLRRYFVFADTVLADSLLVGRVVALHPAGDAP